MEVPDVLVVTKADLGNPARRAEEDLRVALRSLGAKTPVLAVSSLAPTSGIAELVDALDAHERRDRVQTRRLGALADFVHEYGESGLRALGGRRAALRLLAAQPPELDEPALLARLSQSAQSS
jgi:LAO/AO transport system kinase